jgi:hypothetical protein
VRVEVQLIQDQVVWSMKLVRWPRTLWAKKMYDKCGWARVLVAVQLNRGVPSKGGGLVEYPPESFPCSELNEAKDRRPSETKNKLSNS